MLIHIAVSHFQLIEKTSIDLTSSMIACTGESGSGKSSLLNAISVALGLLRADENLIRKSASKATIELHFAVEDFSPALKERLRSIRQELDLDIDESRLILSRTIERKRPSKAQIDAKSVPLKLLQRLGLLLCEVLDQGAGHSLNSPSTAITYLDVFAGATHQLLIKEVSKLFEGQQVLTREQQRLKDLLPVASTKIPLLEEEIAEIEASIDDMKIEADLFAQFSGCTEVQERKESLSEIHTLLNVIGDPIQKCTHLSKQHFSDALLEQIQLLHTSWQECSWLSEKELQQCEDHYDRDLIEQKLQKVERLKRRFGKDYDQVRAYYQNAQNELWELHSLKDRIDDLDQKIKESSEHLEKKVSLLSKSRESAAAKLAKVLTMHLSELNFQGAVAQVELTESPLSKEGREKVRFLLTPGKGARAVDLHKSASGGERARFYLALKLAGCQEDPPPLLILDEVDASLGGVSAKKMQEKLQALSKDRQILCITHFPQVAKDAPQHICVEKVYESGVVQSRFVDLMNQSDRDQEIHRMLGGQPAHKS